MHRWKSSGISAVSLATNVRPAHSHMNNGTMLGRPHVHFHLFSVTRVSLNAVRAAMVLLWPSLDLFQPVPHRGVRLCATSFYEEELALPAVRDRHLFCCRNERAYRSAAMLRALDDTPGC